MRTIADAQARILSAFTPRTIERLPLLSAHGRHLAESISTKVDAPAFDNSAMDGWALRSADLPKPTTLRACGESRAGGDLPSPLEPGTTMRIFTGAPLPEGADAVIPQEEAERRDGRVHFAVAAERHRHVRLKGEELRRGETLLEAGSLLHAGTLGLLASQGIGRIAVHRRPVMALLPTGDELRDLEAPAKAGSIIDSNSYALSAAAAEAGAEVRVLPRAADEIEALRRSMESALEADLLVTTGGVSVGSYDVVRDAFEAAGVRMELWKIAIKPGKPLVFGVGPAGTPVLGLPGNPVSAAVTFEVFVRPGIRRMLGDPKPFATPLRATLGSSLKHRRGRTELVRARIEPRDGGWVALPLAARGSAHLSSMASADALIPLPAQVESMEEGSIIQVLLLRPLRSPTRGWSNE